MTTLTPAQQKALDVIRANGSSFVTGRTWPAKNEVHHRSVAALERLGMVETYLGGDGRFVRETNRTCRWDVQR